MSNPSGDGLSIEELRASVFIANVNPGHVSHHFVRSLVDLIRADEHNGWDCWRGNLWAESGANISKVRNELVTRFLDQPDSEWLLFLDSDMVFPKDTIVRLLAAAKHSDVKVISGLCVMVTDMGPIPTLYQFDNVEDSDGITRVMFDYPDNAVVQVAATGAACLMVHRSVIESMQEAAGGSPYAWFQECTMARKGTTHWVSEDISFCLRANDLGHSVFVDCTLEIGHHKHGRIWYPKDIREGTGQPRRKLVAVIPMKDRLALTQDLVGQLREQGDVDEIVICDNGSGKKTKNWLSSQEDLTVLDCPDDGIHEMWNKATAHALERHTARVRVAFLNNDLRLGPEFLKRLSRALDDNKGVTAVCGNYDGRTSDTPLVHTEEICAARYDGTGGFAGFAFMVRGEWFSSGYRFPEEMKWWCGDNDLLAAIYYSSREDEPKSAAIVVDATVEHLDGGGATAGDALWTDPKWDEMKATDLEAFRSRWQRIAEADDSRRKLAEGDLTPIYEQLCQAQSDINEHLPTFYKLVQDLDAKKVVELGTRGGVSTVAWLAGVHQTDGHLWAVDLNPCPQQIADHPRLTFTQGHDLDPFVLQQLPDDVDIVFVDSDHTYELTQAEIATFSKRIRPGGAAVFHDTAVREHEHHTTEQPPYPVRTAVTEWAEAEGYEVVEYPNNFGLMVVTVGGEQ
jgi:predicted O-methyltransferase YrrM/GT2 family glycosyltransferase